MRHLWLILLSVTIASMGCSRFSGSPNQAIDTTQVQNEQKLSVVAIPDSALELYSYDMTDGKVRVFFVLIEKYELNLYTITTSEGHPNRLGLVYDRYNNGHNYLADGWYPPLFYKVSPDGHSLYVVTRMYANSDGWICEYQLFQINCETMESRLIADCAAIEATDQGFTIAVARLTNEDTAQFVYQEVWMMHDQLLDLNGNIIGISPEEYSYEQMAKRFAFDSEPDHLVKGFQWHNIDDEEE